MMPEAFTIKGFLEAHRAEVKSMLLTEYNEAKTMELFRREAREEGLEEGRREGRLEGRREGESIGLRKGEDQLGALITQLLSLGRSEDIPKAASDPAYRQKLYAELQILH